MQSVPLRKSHVLPAFIYRWLRGRSVTGHIRSSDNPNRRVQDGLKLSWMCQACETLFSGLETSFATKLFHPWNSGIYRIPYRDWLLKFCVSVSWRVLRFAHGRNKLAPYTQDQQDLLHRADARWRAFLVGDVQHPGEFEQHLLIFDNIVSTTVLDLPSNINRYMTGAVTFDLVGSSRSLMTFAKLGPFIIFGMIQKGPHRWDGTKVHVESGLLKPQRATVPADLLDLFKEKAEHAASAMDSMSPGQKAKVDALVQNDLDRVIGSAHFTSMLADARMFGEAAILRKE